MEGIIGWGGIFNLNHEDFTLPPSDSHVYILCLEGIRKKYAKLFFSSLNVLSIFITELVHMYKKETHLSFTNWRNES